MDMAIKIISWNVNGIRACAKKGFLDFLKNEKPDVLCIQETKASQAQWPKELLSEEGYEIFYSDCQIKKGYSGVAVYSRLKPRSVSTEFAVEKFNVEGRILRLDFGGFVLFNLYVPNGSQGEERLNYKMEFSEQLMKECEELAGKRILICGDYNTAHNEIDLKHPKANEKNSGFLPMERAWMDRFLQSGFVDTFRNLYPEEVKYSWWTYRAGAREKNVGWRIDYVCVNQDLAAFVKDAFILNDVYGSDHCPVGVLLDESVLG